MTKKAKGETRVNKTTKNYLKWMLITLPLVVGLTWATKYYFFGQNSPVYGLESEECTENQVQAWIEQLKEENNQAFDNLVACRSKSVSLLIKQINDQDTGFIDSEDDEIGIDSISIAILGEIGEEAKEAIPVLVALVKNPKTRNQDSQLLAANALVKMGKTGQEAINNLVSTYMSGLDRW